MTADDLAAVLKAREELKLQRAIEAAKRGMTLAEYERYAR
jgi:hypothetical protein